MSRVRQPGPSKLHPDGKTGAAGTAAVLADILAAYLPSVMAQWRQPGLAVAVEQAGAPPWAAGFGVCRLGERTGVDADTMFALASCSKPFAAMAVALLVDDGLLTLDDRVVELLPWFALSDPAITRQVTLRDLLCNRLGITSSEGRHRQAAVDRRDLIERLRYHRFRHPFRAQFGYCTDAFTVLGEVVTAVTGQPWSQFVQRRLWEPLGMLRTNADVGRASVDGNHASPHLDGAGGFRSIPWVYEDAVAAPAGGVNSTATDLLCWLRFLLQGGVWEGRRLVSASIFRQLWEPHTVETGEFADHELSRVVGRGEGLIEQESYALGSYRHLYRGCEVLYHCGSIDGFRAIVGHVPALGLGVAVLANADNAYLPKMIFQQVLDRALATGRDNWSERFLAFQVRDRCALQQAPGPARGRPELVLQPGRYRDDTGFGDAMLSLEDDALVLTVGALSFDLRRTGGGAYLAHKRWPYACAPQFTAWPETDANGRYTGFSTSQDAWFSFVGRPDLNGGLGPVFCNRPGTPGISWAFPIARFRAAGADTYSAPRRRRP